MSTCAVYTLTLVETGVFYIGSTKNVDKRIRIHLRRLSNNSHGNKNLQEAWNSSVSKEFFANAFPVAGREEAFALEEKFIRRAYESPLRPLLANMSLTAKGSDSIARHPDKDFIIRKREESRKITYAKLSDDERAKRFSLPRLGSRNGMYGKTHTPEVRKKLSEFHKGHKRNVGLKLSPEHVEKIRQRQKLRIGPLNSFYGKTHSPENIEKARKRMLGVKSKNNKRINAEGVVFETCADAAKHFNISPGLVTYRLKKGYKDWKVVNQL